MLHARSNTLGYEPIELSSRSVASIKAQGFASRVSPRRDRTTTPRQSVSYEFTSSDDDRAAGLSADSSPTDDSWDGAMARLRDRFPKASDGILFCVFKLQQNQELTIRDFRDEATLHGIKLGGRAFHSAKVLLGMDKPATRRSSSNGKRRSEALLMPDDSESSDVESSLITAVQQIQEAATAEAHRLRDAMRKAVEVLQRALDGREPSDESADAEDED